MKRITITADAELLERLREVARREGLSLAAVIRQGLEWRVAQTGAPLRFIAAGASSGRPDDIGRLTAYEGKTVASLGPGFIF